MEREGQRSRTRGTAGARRAEHGAARAREARGGAARDLLRLVAEPGLALRTDAARGVALDRQLRWRAGGGSGPRERM